MTYQWNPLDSCTDQRSSLVVEYSRCVWQAPVRFPVESNQIFQIGSLSFVVNNARHKKGSSKLIRCQNNVTGWNIIRLCLWCDISVRQHYKAVIIPSVTSRHRPNMTWNVLKGTWNTIPPPHKKMDSCTKVYILSLRYNKVTPCHLLSRCLFGEKEDMCVLLELGAKNKSENVFLTAAKARKCRARLLKLQSVYD